MTEYEQVIKNYMDKQVQKDAALALVYNPSKIGECFNFIKEEARKKAKNGCAMIEDAQVFKWARDFFLEGKPSEPPAPKPEKKVEEQEEKKPEFEEVNGIKYDPNGNGCLFDF